MLFISDIEDQQLDTSNFLVNISFKFENIEKEKSLY